jgi:hypothetical protein
VTLTFLQRKRFLESLMQESKDLGDLSERTRLPSGFWDSQNNRRHFIDWLGKELGFKSMDDWYKITHDTIEQNGGALLLNKCGGSRLGLLQSVYPEHAWHGNNFATALWYK